MEDKNRNSALARNQNSGTGQAAEWEPGHRAPIARNITRKTGKEKRSHLRSSGIPLVVEEAWPPPRNVSPPARSPPAVSGWARRGLPASRVTARFPRSADRHDCWRISAMKKDAKPIERYSVWNPPTSSLSASGRSNEQRAIGFSERKAIRKMMKLKI